MSIQITVGMRLVVEGQPLLVSLVDNPLIDDVMVTEARVQAASIMTGLDLTGHRVERDIRDFLIKLGVNQ